MLTDNEVFEVNLWRSLSPSHPASSEISGPIKHLGHFATQKLNNQIVIVALTDRKLEVLPWVVGAIGFADAFKPSVKRPVMILNTVVGLRLKSKRVVHLHSASAAPTSNRFFVVWTAPEKHFHVHHVMLLDVLWVVVLGWVENDISRLHLTLLQLDRQRVVLVGLIAASERKPELVPQVVNPTRNEGTAV